MSALYRPVKVLTGSSRSIRTIIIFYVDLALPFGLRSAPFIFNNVADMLEWILRNNYGIHIHYLDDYFTVGPPVSDPCSRALASTKATSTRLRVPLAPEKSVGPTTCIIFLGIELDSIELYARLPSDKLIELRSLITTWFGERSWTRRELESLVGKLQNASAVVRPGRMLLRRLFDALRTIRLHHITIIAYPGNASSTSRGGTNC